MARISCQIRHGNGEMAKQSPGLLLMATVLHTSPKTVEKNSLKPICGIASCGYQSFIMDIKLNENTSEGNNDFSTNIKHVISDLRLTYYKGRA